MTTLLISFLTLLLLLISVFIVLIVLMQRSSQSGGMGSALGGGAAESAFGADTGNVLTKGTIYGIIAFFIVGLGLYLLYQSSGDTTPSGVDAEELVGDEAAGASGEPAGEGDGETTDTPGAGTINVAPGSGESDSPADDAANDS